MNDNYKIFERVKASLTQNNKKLSSEDLEVAKCIFAAMVTGVSSGNSSDRLSSVSNLIYAAEKLGFIQVSSPLASLEKVPSETQ